MDVEALFAIGFQPFGIRDLFDLFSESLNIESALNQEIVVLFA